MAKQTTTTGADELRQVQSKVDASKADFSTKPEFPGRPAEATADLVSDTAKGSKDAVGNTVASIKSISPIQETSAPSSTQDVKPKTQEKQEKAVATEPQQASRPGAISASITTAQEKAAQGSGYEPAQQEKEASTDNSLIDESVSRTGASRLFRKQANERIKQIQESPKQEETVATSVDSNAAKIEEAQESTEPASPETFAMAAIPDQKQAPVTHSLPDRTFKTAENKRKDNASKDVQDKRMRGDAIVVKITGDRKYRPEEIAVGTEEIEAMIAQPRNSFLKLVEEYAGVKIDPESMTWREELMEAVNNKDIRIPVGVYKSPVNRSSSAQQRILRIYWGRGAKMHPTQSKSFNADFDGDDVTITFDRKATKKMKPTQSYLMDIDDQPSLDFDFFPTPKLSDTGYPAAKSKKWLRSLFDGKVSDALIDAIFNLCEGPNTTDPNEYKKELANLQRTFVTAIHLEALRYGDKTARRESDMLFDIYNGLQQANMVRVEMLTSQEEVSLYSMPDKTRADEGIINILEDMHGGKPPMNFQEFKVAMNQYIGAADNKNIAFRISANIAKMIKLNERIMIGEEGSATDSESAWFHLYEQTMSMGVSLQMSNFSSLADRASHAGVLLRNLVLAEVGMPSSYPNINAFLEKFHEVYSKHSQLMNIANVEFLTDFTARTGKTFVTELETKKLSDIVTPLEKVYGQFTIGDLFSGFSAFNLDKERMKNDQSEREIWQQDGYQFIHVKYRDKTLSEFTKSNTVNIQTNYASKVLGPKLISDVTVENVLQMLADKRRSSASKYNKTLTGKDEDGKKKSDGVLDKMHKAIKDIKKFVDDAENGNPAKNGWKEFVSDLAELLYGTSPNLFDYYGMISAKTFVESEYGKALLEAENADVVGGIRIAMIIEQRMSKIDNEENRFNSVVQNEHAASEAIANAANRISREIDALASSSQAWRAVVEERFDSAAWKDLSSDSRTRITESTLNAGAFWSSPTHDNLYDFLIDLSVGKELKEAVLSDVVRWRESFGGINAFEMTYQLEQGPSKSFLKIGASDKSSVIDAIKESDSKFDSYAKKDYEAAVKNIEDAFEKYGNTNKLSIALSRVAKDSSLLISLDDQIVGAAVASPLDKMFATSEKSGQMPGPNALYMGLSYQKNGGLYTDVYRGDDRALGIVRWDMLSMHDIITILADETNEFTLNVYGPDGNIIPITRNVLCGVENATERDVWNFLRNNPRIALALRPHRVNVFANSEGSAFLSAYGSTAAFISQCSSDRYDEVRSLVKAKMIDHPMFHAMAALIVPVRGKTSRTATSEYIKAEKYLVNQIIKLAQGNGQFNVDTKIEEILGITKDKLREMRIEEDIIEDMFAYLRKSINNYAGETSKILANYPGYNPGNEKFDVDTDIESVAMYFDVMQELSGAKTAVSTGVEGTETYKMATWMSLLAPKDNYDIVGSFTEPELLEQLNGQITNVGFAIGEKPIEEIEKLAGEDPLIVEVPETWVVEDSTTDSYGQQISSVNRFLIIKRDKGAEEFNLKVKKFGIDEYDSITKNEKYDDTEYSQLLIKIRQEEATNGLFSAKMLLAKHIKNKNEALGYDDMDLANWMSVADLMLVKPEDGELCLRSIEQIGYAIKNHLARNLIHDGTIDGIRAEAAAIADAVGTTESYYDAVELVSKMNVHGTSPFSPVIRQRSSAWHRNYNLVKEIHADTGATRASDSKIQEELSSYKDSIGKQTAKILGGYRFIGAINGLKVRSVGPRDLLTVDPGDMDSIKAGLDEAYRYGNTVFVAENQAPYIPEEYAKALVPARRGFVIPMFDLRLNGSEAKPHNPMSASWQCDPSRVVYSYEDQINEYSLGDSDIVFFNALVDRMSFNWGGTQSISSGDLFASTFEQHSNAIFKIELMQDTDIKKLIINEMEQYKVDLGLDVQNRDFQAEKERMDNRIEKYKETYLNTNPKDGFITNAKPDEIVAWVRCTIKDPGKPVQYVYAPVIPFKIDGSLSVPTDFEISDIDFGVADGSGNTIGDKSAINIKWKYSGSTQGQWIKMHEGAGAANKTVGMLDGVPGLSLKNGRSIDCCYHSATTSSRRGGTLKRMATMNTLMFTARDYSHGYGYNFASDCAGAFPESEKLRTEFAQRRFSTDEWQKIINSNERIHADEDMNNFCRFIARKCISRRVNPSDFFASEFNGIPTDAFFEFESLYEQTIGFQDCLMRFYNSMMPSLCPNSTKGDWRPCLFRPNNEGCLQMQVPHRSAKNPGVIFYTWENVYAGWGFFGEDYSGFKRPSINGASRYMDAINTMALSGQQPNGFEFRKQLEWAMSDMGGYNMPYSITPEKRK